MRNVLAVAAGGAIGSVARYLLGRALTGPAALLPWGTLAVNGLGALALGLVLAAWPGDREALPRLLLGVGLCGGFTTFSAFSAELVALLEQGHAARAAGYAAASLALGVAGVLVGLALGRALGWR